MSAGCACCQRPWEVVATFSGQRARPEGRADSSVCADCFPHQGYAMQANTEHLSLWTTYVEQLQDRHAGQVTELHRVVAARDRALAERPEKVVDRYVDADVLNEARDEADRAFRSRENAYQALCEVRVLHRELDDGICRCGLRFDRCDVGKIVDRYPALRTWEAKQVDRLKRGESHRLPEGHPALLDRRWTNDPRHEWQKRPLTYLGPRDLLAGLVREFDDRMVDVDQEHADQVGGNLRVALTAHGPGEAIDEAVRAFRSTHTFARFEIK